MLSLFFDKVLFIKKCVGCNTPGEYFCQVCILNIFQSDLICPECERSSIGGLVHPLCRKRVSMDGLWSLGIYRDPLKKAIQKLKYRFVSELAAVLVDLTTNYWARYSTYLFDTIKKDGGVSWVIVPVPLHIKRQNWRGFNQSALLGQKFAQKLGLNYVEALKRDKMTSPQASLLGHDRRLNVKGAFSKNPECMIDGKSVILIDDVWTTGSTMRECAKILKRSGAAAVWGLTLAR